jgi:hypothetical protein
MYDNILFLGLVQAEMNNSVPALDLYVTLQDGGEVVLHL